MDKKIITSCLFALFSMSLFGQQWTTVDVSYFGQSGFWLGTSNDAKQFKIDKSTNTLWSSWFDDIFEIEPNGNTILHNNQSDSNLPSGSAAFLEFAFSGGQVYTVDLYTGITFSYNGSDWQGAVATNGAIYVSAEDDTVWICQSPGDVVQLISGTPTYYTTATRRIQSRNGHVWAAQNTTGDGISFLRYFETGLPNWYQADVHDYLLDNYQNDFKFMNNSDTFYVSGNQGFSIAIGDTFVDTLTIFNTTNMPYPEIIEFEFDQNDDVWALFGTDRDNISHIGFLDRSINDWTMVFDANDSPIDYSDYMSLELDSDGNVYVMQRDQLHVFGDNGGPQWLDIKAYDLDYSDWVYPNPTDGIINLSSFKDHNVETIQIHDTQGHCVHRGRYQQNIQVNLDPGLYFLRLDNRPIITIQIK